MDAVLSHKGYDVKEHAKLILADGTEIRGKGFGAQGVSKGELVFTTNMTGYPESLTDPSYNGQILMPTYPLIGNYSFDKSWMQGAKIWVEGFVVHELCEVPQHRAGKLTLDELLKQQGIPGICDVDTRMLTRKIRKFGVINAILINGSANYDLTFPAADLVGEVTTKQNYVVNESGTRHVVLIDCGVKRAMVDSLVKRNAKVTIVPATTTAKQVMKLSPDGVLVSNGPGDPQDCKCAIKTVQDLHQSLPIFGICLGHQILCLALGGQTYKLKFGHRGSNHAVRDYHANRISMVSQNHGYAVDKDSLANTELKVTITNLNDKTVEGVRHESLPIIGVQYHPEAHPGPHDSAYIFDEFIRMMGEKR